MEAGDAGRLQGSTVAAETSFMDGRSQLSPPVYQHSSQDTQRTTTTTTAAAEQQQQPRCASSLEERRNIQDLIDVFKMSKGRPTTGIRLQELFTLEETNKGTRGRGGATGKAFGLAISRSRVRILLEATLRNNLGQVVYTYVPLSPSSIT